MRESRKEIRQLQPGQHRVRAQQMQRPDRVGILPVERRAPISNSGRIRRPWSPLARLKPAAAQNGSRGASRRADRPMPVLR